MTRPCDILLTAVLNSRSCSRTFSSVGSVAGSLSRTGGSLMQAPEESRRSYPYRWTWLSHHRFPTSEGYELCIFVRLKITTASDTSLTSAYHSEAIRIHSAFQSQHRGAVYELLILSRMSAWLA